MNSAYLECYMRLQKQVADVQWAVQFHQLADATLPHSLPKSNINPYKPSQHNSTFHSQLTILSV